MIRISTIAIASAMALSASVALAQTNGPNGMRPNTLGSDRVSSGINAKQPSRAIMNPRSSMYNSGARMLHPRRHHRLR